MHRRFEFVAGNSYKFWEISVAGCRTTISFGRIGTSGQVQVKTFHNPQEAQQLADKLIAQKLKKGYAEVQQAAA